MTVGIHFSNKREPTNEDYRLFNLCKPEFGKMLLWPASEGVNSVEVFRKVRENNPKIFMVARLFAPMSGGIWSVERFVNEFEQPIARVMSFCNTFEIHNEPNLDIEWPGTVSQFVSWIVEVRQALSSRFPTAKWVFPGQGLVFGYEHWWDAVMLSMAGFDYLGCHNYWQEKNWLHSYFGLAHERLHGMWPNKKILITEFGDSTNGRPMHHKLPGYLDWYRHMQRVPYVEGTALYICGGTSDWDEFNIDEQTAVAIGNLPREEPVIIPPSEEIENWSSIPFSLARPLPDRIGVVSQWFGENPKIYERFGLAGHNGIDYKCIVGTPVLAQHEGIVTQTGNDPQGWGLFVRYKTWWAESIKAHLSRILVCKGDAVRVGDLLGLSGNTGFSTGPHVHAGTKVNDMSNLAYNNWTNMLAFRYRRDESVNQLERIAGSLEKIEVNTRDIVFAIDDLDFVVPPGTEPPVTPPPVPPVPSKPHFWMPWMDQFAVSTDRRNGENVIVAVWATMNGSWEPNNELSYPGAPDWARRLYLTHHLGGEHHLYGRCEWGDGSVKWNNANGERIQFLHAWGQAGMDHKPAEGSGWANSTLGGGWNDPNNSPSGREWFCFGGDKLVGPGLPWNRHVSWFVVWCDRSQVDQWIKRVGG